MIDLATSETTPAPRLVRGAGGSRPLRVLRTVASRIGWILVVVWAAVTLTFVLARIVPANPARLAAGLNASPEAVRQVAHDLGLDLPLWQQYLHYLGGVVTLDLGDSIQTQQPVLEEVLRYLPATLELVVGAFVVYAILGVLLGLVWAAIPKGIHARVISAVSVIGAAMPVFWIALILQLVVASGLGWLPVSGDVDLSDYGLHTITGSSVIDSILQGSTFALGDSLVHLVLPVTALVLSQIGVPIRLTRTAVAAELRRPYFRVSVARGNSRRSAILHDAMRNALAPVVTMLGLQFGWLLGGTILVEVVFSWPGLGLYAYNAFRTFDYNPILAITLFITATFVIVNEITDAIIRRLDPRLEELA